VPAFEIHDQVIGTRTRVRSSRRDAVSATHGLAIGRLSPEASCKDKAYAALKEAIVGMDVYDGPGPTWLDERELSLRLGVSRTPIREAMTKLEQEGFVQIVPRRGILVSRKSKREIVEMIQAWAALESMAARLITHAASDAEIASLRDIFAGFGAAQLPPPTCEDYETANTVFHLALIHLSGSTIIQALTDNLRLHVRAICHRTGFERDNMAQSLADHLAIIAALEARDADTAERLARDHTLRLSAYAEEHANLA
jgi:DNA-binding GntR family transcriptional regulator